MTIPIALVVAVILLPVAFTHPNHNGATLLGVIAATLAIVGTIYSSPRKGSK